MAASMLCNLFSKLPLIGSYFRGKMDSKELNEKFYQRILQFYEKDNSIAINRVEKTPACEKGDSFVSQVSRVKVFGYKDCNQKNEEYQKILIVKELPPYEQRQLYRSHIAMENEYNAYTKVIPALKRHTIDQLPVVDCIYADEDVIILEDLSLHGFAAVGRSNGGLTLEQCQIVLEGLAKFHAASFVLKRKEPEKFEELSKLMKELLFHGGDSPLLNSQTSFIENAFEIFKNLPLNGESQKATEVLHDLKQHSRSKLKQLLLNPREHSVMCHGDPWATNIMFNNKNELKLVDFQLMRYNSVASDLCYLLYVNLSPQIRNNSTEKLLDGYLSSLRENIKEKGVNMDDVLTKEWLEKEMEIFAIYGIVFSIWIMPVFFVKKEDVEITEKRVNNTSKTAEQAGPGFEDRIKELMLEYVRSLP